MIIDKNTKVRIKVFKYSMKNSHFVPGLFMIIRREYSL